MSYKKKMSSILEILISLLLFLSCSSFHRADSSFYFVNQESDDYLILCKESTIQKKWYIVYGSIEIGRIRIPELSGNTVYRIREFKDRNDLILSILAGAFTSMTRSSYIMSECKMTVKIPEEHPKIDPNTVPKEIINEFRKRVPEKVPNEKNSSNEK